MERIKENAEAATGQGQSRTKTQSSQSVAPSVSGLSGRIQGQSQASSSKPTSATATRGNIHQTAGITSSDFLESISNAVCRDIIT